MLKNAFKPRIPTKAAKALDRPEWIHEIKHDGYRLIVQRDGKRARLFSRNGYDWRHRFPLIYEAALRHRSSSFVLDGEAVPLGVDGRSDFDGLTATELTVSRTAPVPKNKHPPGLHHVLFMSQLHPLLNVRLDALADRQQPLRKRYDLPLAR